jgi:hypothetical protein
MFGLLAAILDSAAHILAHNGVGAALTTWQPYLLAVVAPTGEVFAQSAFQAGPLSASLPILSTVEPSTAIAIAIIVFGERISDTPAALGAEAIALLAVVMGVLTLDRSSLLPSRCDQQDHPMAEDFPQQRVA